ncbi:hypothetical protein PV772_05965 [Pseudarthrobacter sp. CC12]
MTSTEPATSGPLSAREPARVIVVNPLGVALGHYTAALCAHLRDSGAETEVISVAEPSQSGNGRLQWLISYTQALVSAGRLARQSAVPSKVLVTWPVLGFVDLFTVKLTCGSSGMIVYHDPRPLVRSLGSSSLLAGLAAHLRRRPGTLVHSSEAAEAMRGLRLGDGVVLLPHPMLPVHDAMQGFPSVKGDSGPPIIRVLGQYKPDRDVALLEELATRLTSKYTLEIVGRGWPAVSGWTVVARFVPEDELDQLISTSDAIIIPYRRFYQSGIAIRALEQAVPIVGRAGTSLRELYGAQSKLLVMESGEHRRTSIDGWISAIDHAVAHGRTEAALAGKLFHEGASSGWASLYRSWLQAEP